MGQGSDRNRQIPGVHCLAVLATLGVPGLGSFPVSVREGAIEEDVLTLSAPTQTCTHNHTMYIYIIYTLTQRERLKYVYINYKIKFES